MAQTSERLDHMVCILTQSSSKRLTYIVEQIFQQWLGMPIMIHTPQDTTVIPAHAYRIGYGVQDAKTCLYIPSTSLLFEEGVHIKHAQPNIGEWQGIPTLFAVKDNTTSSTTVTALPFDFFAACFWLLSRYEEMLPNVTKDEHQRFPIEQSWVYQNVYHTRPLIDEWMHEILMFLNRTVSFNYVVPKAQFLPTYDLDIPYRYQYKSFFTHIGQGIQHIIKGEWQHLKTMRAVISGRVKDPYDAFDQIVNWHQSYQLPGVYFILSAQQQSTYDRHLPLHHTALQKLLRKLHATFAIGIHPSYNSSVQTQLVEVEKVLLEKYLQQKVQYSRQHYIRFQWPYTMEALAQAGIEVDYSMGYATSCGYRAGTGRPFIAYNILNESQIPIQIVPFYAMDTAMKFGLKWDATTAYKHLESVWKTTQQLGTQLVVVHHNFSLGNDVEWKGWQAGYAAFLERLSF